MVFIVFLIEDLFCRLAKVRLDGSLKMERADDTAAIGPSICLTKVLFP